MMAECLLRAFSSSSLFPSLPLPRFLRLLSPPRGRSLRSGGEASGREQRRREGKRSTKCYSTRGRPTRRASERRRSRPRLSSFLSLSPSLISTPTTTTETPRPSSHLSLSLSLPLSLSLSLPPSLPTPPLSEKNPSTKKRSRLNQALGPRMEPPSPASGSRRWASCGRSW